MVDHEPQSARVKSIHEQVSDERWERLVADALGRLKVLELVVEKRKEDGRSWREAASRRTGELRGSGGARGSVADLR